MVIAYWQIGKRIVEEEQQGQKKAGYGELLLKNLAVKLTTDFGKGFTLTNLKYFRQFYIAFPPLPISNAVRGQSFAVQKSTIQKSHAVRGQLKTKKNPALPDTMAIETIPNTLRKDLSWTHYRLLMRVDNPDARNYYINEAVEENWSTRTLERQINTLYYERILSSKNKQLLKNDTKRINAADTLTPSDIIKDPYIFEFLGLTEKTAYLEKDLETELINKLQHFILELGKGYSFVARQKRITADDEHFYIDLVFYNYLLKCFVLIDLKLGKLTHQDIGQMDLYVRYWEDNEKTTGDNPTIGLILCSQKNETIVKYSVLKGSKQLFASKYKLYLPTEQELIKEIEFELQQIKLRKK